MTSALRKHSLLAVAELRATQALVLLLLALLALYLWYFALHVQAMLAFAYPLDYGEGPLLQQARLLDGGLGLSGLYGDPAQPPYVVANYPPLYLLLTLVLARFTGDLLLAGRLLSLLAALACAVALGLLIVRSGRIALPALRGVAWPAASVLLPLAFLALPLVRQWALLMRVDMLGLALGLWALLLLVAEARRPSIAVIDRRLLLIVGLLVASLYAKPSLLAAPLAAASWLLLRAPRRGLALLGLLLGAGGTLFLLLQLLTSGRFALHTLAANANRWEPALAWQFWREQLRMLWPLLLAVALAAPALRRSLVALPLLYLGAGALTALGVGKVGAYANYFLEFDAGLLWMLGLLLVSAQRGWVQALLLLALLAGFVYYVPLWDAEQPRQAGLLSPNPPRLVFGNYGLWADQRREQQLLATFAAWQHAITRLVQAERGPLFTDTPGLLVAAGAVPRLQAFEHRQLLDQGLWPQGELLRQLANGDLPLAVVDYLGNWLSPQMVTLLRQRYALDGSVGVYSVYRPLALGQSVALEAVQGGGLALTGYRLAAATGQVPYSPGETLALALEWRRVGALRPGSQVVVELRSPKGVLVAHTLPLLYAALGQEDWPLGVTLQHMQPLRVPADAPPGEYTLTAALRGAQGELVIAPQTIARVQVGPQAGRVFAGGLYVPAPMLAGWQQFGGEGAYGPGQPLTPAVPFAGGVLQCFERACFDLGPQGLTRRPLGQLIGLDAPMWPEVTLPATQGVAAPLLPLWQQCGGAAALGAPTTAPLERLGLTVQYTEYARLERAAGGSFSLGRLGDDYLRLPPGVGYPWPPPAPAARP